MKFLTRIAVLFYVTFMLFWGCTTILFVLNWLDFGFTATILYGIYSDESLQLIFGSLAAALLLINFGVYRFFSVNIHRDKTIAFDNPGGRVSVSLSAIEELVKRLLMRFQEVKECKPKIRASKKGLDVKIKLMIKSNTNIPDVTARVQEQVKDKIQDLIGIDEPIKVAIYVSKILQQQSGGKPEKPSPAPDDKQAPNIPFQGYRA